MPWVLLFGLLAGTGVGAAIGNSEAPTTQVPSSTVFSGVRPPTNRWLVGFSLSRAKAIAGQERVRLYVIPAPSQAPKGRVVGQDPNLGSDETVVVSTGHLLNDFQVLSPATVPPVTSECAAGLELDEDGNVGPLTCDGDHVNVAAWKDLARVDPVLMKLSRGATEEQASAAICTPVPTAPIRDSSYQLAEAYYGWHFGEQLLLDRLYGLHGLGCSYLNG